jgi:uncharacterized SAM-binding protein YcdF (DUF218 family)
MNTVLPVFAMPVFVGLSLVIVGLAVRRPWLGALGVVVVWVAATPLVGDHALRWIETGYQRSLEADAPEADLIVVLSGGRHPAPGPHGVSEWTDPDRFFAGVSLWEAGKAPTLVFTGGGSSRPGLPTEGEILRDTALRLGVDPAAIVVTGRVATTIDEAEALACMVNQGAPDAPAGFGEARRILLVTSAFHLPRAARAFERHGFEVAGFPVDFQSTDPSGWRATMLLPSSVSLRNTELAWREVIGRVVERLRGLGPVPRCVVA